MARSNVVQLLVVTGAGASRPLGTDGKPMPLMADWARELAEALRDVDPSLPAALGLQPNMDGEAFEKNLGDFLSWRRALPDARRHLRLGSLDMQVDPASAAEWFDLAQNRAGEVVRRLHKLMWDLFGGHRVDAATARSAYEALLRLLGHAPGIPIIIATTNYDDAAQQALQALNLRPNDGSLASEYEERYLDLDGLLQTPGRTPVLHLHGRIGWYRDHDGRVRVQGTRETFSESQGDPAVLLPNLDKDYAEYRDVQTIWGLFDEAIAGSSHILVLGHSLHDTELVKHLRSGGAKVGVAVRLREGHRSEMLAERDRVVSLLPAAHVVPVEFGPQPRIEVVAWDAWHEQRDPSDWTQTSFGPERGPH